MDSVYRKCGGWSQMEVEFEFVKSSCYKMQEAVMGKSIELVTSIQKLKIEFWNESQ